jgi:23S rRNA pseudouridine1911/1915/1917 synthase
VDKQGTYVDYLRHCKENNTSKIVDKSDENGKKAVLNYRVLEVINNPGKQDQMLSLIDIELLTGRHHQIRVQFAGHATPLYGDGRYGGGLSTKSTAGTVDRARKKTGFGDGRQPLALCARRLAFPHPSDGKRMEFAMVPSSGAFAWFPDRARKLISAQECGKCHKEV